MLSRFRIEASGPTEDAVKHRLINAADVLRTYSGGQWELEDEQLQDSKSGKWGFLTMRRISG